jgi:hypothetical protein
MVLPDRIELSTSPLPMECSTTELRQHALVRTGALNQGIGRKRLHKAGRSLPQGQDARKRGDGAQDMQGTKYAPRLRRAEISPTMAAQSNGSAMKDSGNDSGARTGKAGKDQREARLKLALRENLKRRKSQARERGDSTSVSSGSDGLVRDGEKAPGK